MIRPHYCWSYSKTGVGSFRGDAAAHLNHRGKSQIPKLTEIQSASFTEGFLKWWCWYEYHKWQEGKPLTPTPNMVIFHYFDFAKCSSCFHMRVSLQFFLLLKQKQDIVEQVQITLLKLSFDMRKWLPPAQKTPCQAKLTIATVQGPEWKHLWFLQRFVIHIFYSIATNPFFYLYHLRKYPINLDHRNQPHPVFNHWEYTFQDKQSQFKTVPTLLLVCTWLCRRLCC